MSKPLACGFGDVHVVQIIVTQSGADFFSKMGRASPTRAITPQQTPCPADTILYMQWHDLSIKSVGVPCASIVKFSNGHHPVSGFNQTVAPAGNLPVIRLRIRPAAVLVNIGTGCDAGSRRYADRRGCVGVAEHSSAVGKRVNIGGMNVVCAVAA